MSCITFSLLAGLMGKKVRNMKPHSYTQVFVHLVFSPKGRQSLLSDEIQERVYKFIGQTIVNREHKPYLINGMPDHLHILTGLNPEKSISDLVRDIKRTSSTFINQNRLTKRKFEWQAGYGAFSYSKSEVKRVSRYIANQKFHHSKMTFREEYIRFLCLFGINYDPEFLFEFYD